jgi:hypothetical protein
MNPTNAPFVGNSGSEFTSACHYLPVRLPAVIMMRPSRGSSGVR